MPRMPMSTTFYQDSKGELMVGPTLTRWAGTLCLLIGVFLLISCYEPALDYALKALSPTIRMILTAACVVLCFVLKKLANKMAQKSYAASLEEK